MKEKKLTCIICPKGCFLTVKEQNGEIIVTGNSCNKGKSYAISELTNPQRILTTTLKLDNNSSINRIAVMSKTFVDKDDLIPLCMKLKDVVVKKSIKQGDIICTVDGIEFIASSTVE
jgi:CxxC motif-containing protein